ncbi:MAG: AAA family ATPase [Planctomycetes bacterium]|nr:AAA family ATPase [Planctomycetota bacterium]
MSERDELIAGLKSALEVSPDNVPLRIQLARAYCNLGRFPEAELELREALTRSPHHPQVTFTLAQVYMQQDKNSQALVIVESLTKKPDAPAAAHVLYARLLFREGDVPRAVAQYKLGLELDPDVADEELGRTLGVTEDPDSSPVVEGRLRQGWEAEDSPVGPEVERPKLTFSEIGGMDAVKEEISLKILYPLKHPELYKAYGKTAGGGILMYGPPGCGKTYLARATAGEIGAGFIAVGINDVLDMWIGKSERNLHEVFEQARRNRPCVLFFDEVDALGGRRSDMISGSGRQLINQFLSEMDGVSSSNEGVLILAATNAPWHVDPAFRRPGRFDRILFVPPPDEAGRAAVLRLHCAGKPQENLDFTSVARKCDQFSGADMKAIVDAAIEHRLRDAMKTGKPVPLQTRDLLDAAKGLKPSTREWFASARNYALYSNQGGIYDDVLKYLKLS